MYNNEFDPSLAVITQHGKTVNQPQNPLFEFILEYFLSKTLKPSPSLMQSYSFSNGDCTKDYLRQALLYYFGHPANGIIEGNELERNDSTQTEDNDDITLCPPVSHPDQLSEAESCTCDQLSDESEEIAYAETAGEDVKTLQSVHEIHQNDALDSNQGASPHLHGMERIFGIQPSVIDTHNNLIIRVSLPENIDEGGIDIDINRLRTAIRYKSKYAEQLVPLPKNVDIYNAFATIKGSSLEICIPKHTRDGTKEICIHHL